MQYSELEKQTAIDDKINTADLVLGNLQSDNDVDVELLKIATSLTKWSLALSVGARYVLHDQYINDIPIGAEHADSHKRAVGMAKSKAMWTLFKIVDACEVVGIRNELYFYIQILQKQISRIIQDLDMGDIPKFPID